ncbi:PIG-L deacetylase family protein [Micromonospora sp. MS34]|uniref:PIG-L deacetylase family protein n=1 Tax=Micromonospora sp. MS34 TaxID=3385971 RepID=UPI0039A2FC56
MSAVLAVIAHPDDESFGLGAVIDWFTEQGVPVGVLCFTHGEASTLHAAPGDLATIRATELRAAAGILGVSPVRLLDYADGRLDQTAVAELAGQVIRLIDEMNPSHLLVFDEGGITGHPDHQAATAAALAAARSTRRALLAWVVPETVADRLNAEFGTAFLGRPAAQLGERLVVSRVRQLRAIAAHASQSHTNPVLHRRIALLGDREHLRLLYRPGGGCPAEAGVGSRTTRPDHALGSGVWPRSRLTPHPWRDLPTARRGPFAPGPAVPAAGA